MQSHYQNLTFEGAASDEGEEDHTYLNLSAATYDIPRSMAIYDQPKSNQQVPADGGEYDYPKGLIPLSARLLLNASRQNLNQDDEEEDDREEECDADSLDGRPSPTGKKSFKNNTRPFVMGTRLCERAPGKTRVPGRLGRVDGQQHLVR